MTDQQASVDSWVETRLEAIAPVGDWEPDAAACLGLLHARRRALRARRLRGMAVSIAAAFIFLSVPVTRAFGARCLEACAYATSRVVQLWRADEPEATRPKSVGATIGDLAPDPLGTTSDGAALSLGSLHGRVVMVNFWATWCAPCRTEMPALDALHARYGGQGFDVIGISLDEGGWSAIKSFLDTQRVSYPIVLGTDDVAAGYGGVATLPATFLIDRRGVIVAKMVGPLRDGAYDSLIEKLLR